MTWAFAIITAALLMADGHLLLAAFALGIVAWIDHS